MKTTYPLQLQSLRLGDYFQIAIHSNQANEETPLVLLNYRSDLKELQEQGISNKAPYILIESEKTQTLRIKDTLIIYSPFAADALKKFLHCKYPLVSSLSVYGVTGTNGKTSTTYYAAQVFAQQGIPSACMGTLGYGAFDNLLPNQNLTTADVVHNYATLQSLAKQGFTHVFAEVSSIGIHQKRFLGIDFIGVCLLNLQRDHLDYHKDEHVYHNVKTTWFCTTHAPIKIYDSELPSLVKQNGVSCGKNGDFYMQGNTLHTPFGSLPLAWSLQTWPQFAQNNLAFAYALLFLSAKQNKTKLKPFDKEPQHPKGRWEIVPTPDTNTVLVDYAHTPDAVTAVIKNAQSTFPNKPIWVVLGAGGNRDKGKRPLLAQAAIQGDYVVLTSDNPRNEKPEDILNDMQAGIHHTTKPIYSIVAREEAIHFVLRTTHNAVVLILGKGHEDYQIIGDVKHHLCDQEIVRNFYAT